MKKFTDFHSHWNGVLPTDPFIELCCEQMSTTMVPSETKGLALRDKQLKAWSAWLPTVPAAQREVVLFLRVACALLGGDLSPDNRAKAGEQLPWRGAHAAMFIITYIWWCALRAGVEGAEPLPKRTSAKADYKRLHLATSYLLAQLCCDYRNGKAATVEVLRAIAPLALRELFHASPVSSFDDAYVARGAALELLTKGGATAFNAATVQTIADEGIVYVQMSHTLKKIDTAQAALKEYNKAHKTSPLIIHWLVLFASHRAWLADPGSSWDTSYPADLKAAVKTLSVASSRQPLGVIAGIDWAGPEGFAFTEAQANKLVPYTMKELYDLAPQLGGQLVFRPRVGEGSALLSSQFTLIEQDPYCVAELTQTLHESVMELTDAGARARQLAETDRYIVTQVLLDSQDAMRVTASDPWSTSRADESARRARENVTALLAGLETYVKKSSTPKDWAQRVRVRFGHATHVTPDHIRRMAALGVAADCNLGSNLRTGCIALAGASLTDVRTQELARQADPSRPPYNWDVRRLRGAHPLREMLTAKPPVIAVLGTDGQGVEVTEVAREYAMAGELVGATSPLATKLFIDNALDQVIGDEARAQVRAALTQKAAAPAKRLF